VSEEDRKSRRKEVFAMKVRYRVATATEFTEHKSRDVSMGGTFIETPTPLPPGTLLKLELKLAAERHAIHGIGRVVWVREGQSAGPPGMGIKFIKIDGISKSAIARLA
jgi:uncharacterized protein (TIGR02266 family)